MSKVYVIGGGASGMMAAIMAARNNHMVELFEKNEKLGKKLYITGKGRCNLTNACDKDNFFDHILANPKFLYRAFSGFSNMDTIEFFKQLGLPTKIERGGRVFPASDKSSDVIAVLMKELTRLGVVIHYRSEVKRILLKGGACSGIKCSNNTDSLPCDAIIIAAGGMSYPLTGSTGDGYTLAASIGHTITELSPSLVPINVMESFVKDLEGLSLKNVGVTVLSEGTVIYKDFGECLFTHTGMSGPVILSASSYIIPYLKKRTGLTLSIDLKPALSQEQLDARILSDFDEIKNKLFKNSLEHLLPNKLIDVIIRLCRIDPDKKVNSVTREERLGLADLLKHFTMHITGLGGYHQAVITKGGVNVKEINPQTMESKFVRNVYFAGEVLDMDALTGGFNLQIAWSTGFIAGCSIR